MQLSAHEARMWFTTNVPFRL